MRVLMCKPKHYMIGARDHELNPYMDPKVQPNKELALQQFYNLVTIYKRLGIKVYFLRSRKDLFDQVFTANIAWGINGTFIMANLRPEWRREEIPIAAEWFRMNGFKVAELLPENVFFEGQGDIITTREAHLFCYGIRSSLEAKDEIVKRVRLTKPIVPLRLVSRYFYHGDVSLLYTGQETDKILWYPEAFDDESNRLIENLRSRKLAVDENFSRQNLPDGRRNFPLNGVYYGRVQIFPWSSSFGEFPQQVRRFIEEDGSQVTLIDLSEFGLSGAGARCLTQFLD